MIHCIRLIQILLYCLVCWILWNLLLICCVMFSQQISHGNNLLFFHLPSLESQTKPKSHNFFLSWMSWHPSPFLLFSWNPSSLIQSFKANKPSSQIYANNIENLCSEVVLHALELILQVHYYLSIKLKNFSWSIVLFLYKM